MSDRFDGGGSAFPTFYDQWDYGYERHRPKTIDPGMTLRDYFAAKAMAALIALPPETRRDVEDIPIAAYAVADAMLKARQE